MTQPGPHVTPAVRANASTIKTAAPVSVLPGVTEGNFVEKASVRRAI